MYKYNSCKRAHIWSVKWETTGGRSHQLEGSTREQWSNYEQLMKQQSENTSCLTIVGALITILLGRVNYSWSALPRTLPQEGGRDFVKKENAAGRSASSLSSFLGQAMQTKFACAVRSSLHTYSLHSVSLQHSTVLELLTYGSLTEWNVLFQYRYPAIKRNHVKNLSVNGSILCVDMIHFNGFSSPAATMYCVKAQYWAFHLKCYILSKLLLQLFKYIMSAHSMEFIRRSLTRWITIYGNDCYDTKQCLVRMKKFLHASTLN